jgi:release factor glutamine methyltransferase
VNETLAGIRNQLTDRLSRCLSPQEASSQAHLLMEHFLEAGRMEVARTPQKPVPDIGVSHVMQAADRICAGEPVQYVTGTAWFLDHKFAVSPAVLIPRGETEELVLFALERLAAYPSTSRLKILDIGTGSGCIAISLALGLDEKKIPHHITALDLSEEALAVAKENAQSLQADIHFLQENILSAQPTTFSGFDLIVSNPPYIPPSEKESLAVHVRDHEPHLALFTPEEDPLLFYRKISGCLNAWLKPGGLLMFEVHADYGRAALELLAGPETLRAGLRKDIHGRDRVLWAERSAIASDDGSHILP